MLRFTVAVLAVVFSAEVASACSFCGDGFARRQPLRGHFADAKLVLAGKLKSPRPGADGLGGTTEFHVTDVLKSDPALGSTRVLTIPRYLPVIGNTPPDYVFFCDVVDGKIEPIHGTDGGPAVVEYIRQAAKIGPTAADRGLGFFFRHLDSPDPTVSADAFVEFARAADADIVKAAPALDRAKLRAWIADPKVPDERVGVYAMLLGLCGKPEDGAWLAGQLAVEPRPERYATGLGGLLAGLILLDPARGWERTVGVLTAADRPFSEKLAAIGALRYMQATRPQESRERLLGCYRALIENGDLADLAIDDLRRWGWWDLSAVVFAQYGKPTHAAPAVRRGIVRYALGCPGEEAKAFLAGVRRTDAKLVQQVEESVRLYEAGSKK